MISILKIPLVDSALKDAGVQIVKDATGIQGRTNK